jgi:hypothetical protein
LNIRQYFLRWQGRFATSREGAVRIRARNDAEAGMPPRMIFRSLFRIALQTRAGDFLGKQAGIRTQTGLFGDKGRDVEGLSEMT